MADYEDLKNTNIQLMNRLQSGLSNLKSMVSNYPHEQQQQPQPQQQPQQPQQQQNNDIPTSSDDNTGVETSPCEAQRVTSTPKQRQHEPRITRATPLAEKVHSLLITDTGNIKPRNKVFGIAFGPNYYSHRYNTFISRTSVGMSR